MLNTSAEDDLRTGFAKLLLNNVDEVVQIGGGWEDNLHYFGEVTCDAVAFNDVRDLLNIRVKLFLLPWLQLDLDEGLNVEIQFFEIDGAVVASDNALFLEFADPRSNGW